MVTQEYTYVYAAVSVDGELDSLILPHVNSICMQVFIDEVASRHPTDRIIMVLDGAGWHTSGLLKVPENMRLIPLPPYAPELNPAEHIRDDLREKSFHNRVFDGIDALENHLEASLRQMECDQGRIRSLVAWPWIINSSML
jgi:transposase